MSPWLRRAALFLLMVGAGLAAVLLLSEPVEERRGARVEELTGAEGPEGRLRLRGEGAAGGTQVTFGELDFDVQQEVEVAPGRRELRVVARVHVLSARPDASGAFVARGPEVRLLDAATGAERGRLAAEEARFETDAAVAGDVTLDLGSLRAENWSLRGSVRGEFPLRDGRLAHLECAELLARGPLVTAPGRVTWWCEDLRLSGLDLRWDEATGRLEYEADAQLLLEPAEGRPGLELHAPGGLSLTLPPGAEDPGAAAYGELRGSVSGTASDGSRLAARTLAFEGRSGRLVLHEEALLERGGEDGRALRLQARRITVDADASGQLALAEADGDVRLLATPFAVVPSWMVTERLQLSGDRAQAPGRVTFHHQGLVVAGTQADWDGASGRLTLARESELAVDPASAHALAGLRLVTPAGLVLELPPGAASADAAQARLEGPVRGTLPDGTDLAADVLLFDGPQRRFTLQGGARFRRVDSAGSDSLEAARLTLQGDERGALAVVSADGGVLLLRAPVDLLPTRLVSDSLVREAGLLRAPGRVTWTRGELVVLGEGMAWDEAAGRLELQRDARLTFADPQGRLAWELAAAGGLLWRVPHDALSALDGAGELRGRVTGSSSDGGRLECDRLLLDGPARRLTLQGAARLAVPDRDARPPFTLDGEELVFTSHADGVELHSGRPADFTLGELSGSGADLHWDGRLGELSVSRDLLLRAPDPAGGELLFAAGGPFAWSVPPDATDALREGRGHARGGVSLRGPGREARAAELRVTGPRRQALLLGDVLLDVAGPGGLRLEARDSLDLGAGLDDLPQTLEAAGAVRAELRPRDGSPPLALEAERLQLDRAARRATLAGQARLQRRQGETLERVSAAGLIEVLTDALDRPLRLAARDEVELHSGELSVRTPRLDWDVEADRLELPAGGSLLAAGVWMDFARAEVQPRAARFRIERGVVHVQP